MAKQVFDVCVVGSGPGGGIASYALTRAGLTVALVEAGPRLRPGIDFNAHGTVRGTKPRVTDFAERNHFTGVGDRPAHGFLRALGGRSLCWAGHSLRFGPLDFQHWPITYDEVAPFYSRAERFMGVYGERDGLSNMPDGEFQKAVPLRCGEQLLKRGVTKMKARGRAMEFVGIRKAILTQPHPSKRPTCHYCGHCMAGCEVDAKYTSANTPIPAALRTGRLTLFLNSMMTGITLDRTKQRVTGIEYRDAQNRAQQIACRSLVLACSAIETARHLLLNNLANSSGLAGQRLMSHFGQTVTAVFPELRTRRSSNDDGTDYYHGLLTGLYWNTPSRDFAGTYQAQCGSGLQIPNLAIRDVPGFGSGLKQSIRELNTSHAKLNMQGMMLPSPRKHVDLDHARPDRYGLALPRIHLHYEDNELAMARDFVRVSEEVIEAAGGRVYSKPVISAGTLVIDSNHWAGTACMGRDPRSSVVNPDGQSHDIRNLFIGDASVFPAYPEKNPTLTNIALSWRMSEKLAEKARRGELG